MKPDYRTAYIGGDYEWKNRQMTGKNVIKGILIGFTTKICEWIHDPVICRRFAWKIALMFEFQSRLMESMPLGIVSAQTKH